MRVVFEPFRDDEMLASRSSLEAVKVFDPTMAVQSMADEADINVIVRRFGLTGHVPVLDRLPIEADFVEAVTFQDAQNALIRARDAFMSIPADIRFRFHNDPGQFVAFCSDPKNLPELQRMGLAASPPAPVVPPLPQPGAAPPPAPPAPAAAS